MARLLRMPAVATGATDAVLQDWTVAESAAFAAQEALATVETDKALVDIEAESAGVLLKRLVGAGAQVEVGAPIAVLGEPGDAAADLDRLLAELGIAAPVPAAPPARVFASPLARKLAREAGLTIEELRGTGPGGRVVRRDVDAARSGRAAPPALAPAAPAAPAAPPEPAAAAAVFTEVPHSRMRRAVAERLTRSQREVPHFYLRATLDARRLLRLRERLNDGAAVKVSVNDLMVKAVGHAHALVPELNVTWTADAVRRHETVDVAIAVATERGLVTPVLRGVESATVTAVARAGRELAERARAGRLRQEELEGGSISVTNLGMFGTEEFAAVINPPHAAILAVGAVHDEPVARGGKVRVRPVLRVTLSVDHRPVDGVVAARWLREFGALVENPVRILA